MKNSKIVSERPQDLSLCGLYKNSSMNALILLKTSDNSILERLFAIGGYSDVCY